MRSPSFGLVTRVLVLRRRHSAEISGAAKTSLNTTPRATKYRGEGKTRRVSSPSSVLFAARRPSGHRGDEGARGARLADGPLGPATASIDPAMGDGA
jgi:hypothetical protein